MNIKNLKSFFRVKSFRSIYERSWTQFFWVLFVLDSFSSASYTFYINTWYKSHLTITFPFFWERKISCSSKIMQLLLLNGVKARWSENRAAPGFHYINSLISNIFGPNSKTCPCEVHAAWGRVSRGLTVIHSNILI